MALRGEVTPRPASCSRASAVGLAEQVIDNSTAVVHPRTMSTANETSAEESQLRVASAISTEHGSDAVNRERGAGAGPTEPWRDGAGTGSSPETAVATCVHVAILHHPHDARVFHRECRTLAAAGHEVHLVISAPPASAVDGVRFHACARTTERPPFRRQWAPFLRASWHALSLRAPIYHLHEPHLVPLGLVLKLRGAAVLYDVHEDYPAHARTKLATKPLRRTLKPLVWEVVEAMARWTLDGFVCATPAIARRFPANRTTLVRNVPRLEDFEVVGSVPWSERENAAIYAGNLAAERGLREMVDMIGLLPPDLEARLVLLGSIRRPQLEAELRAKPSWAKVEYLGFQPRAAMIERLARARVGLVLLYPLPNHVEAMPNKLWEYMAAGLPVVASDFPHWRALFERIGCGLLVDPMDPRSIAGAVEYLLTHPDEAEAMGRRGREAVEREFNWQGQGERLLALYDDLASPHGDASINPKLDGPAAVAKRLGRRLEQPDDAQSR
jgi:glycosyltransferase involved in cell wall biosynthesis